MPLNPQETRGAIPETWPPVIDLCRISEQGIRKLPLLPVGPAIGQPESNTVPETRRWKLFNRIYAILTALWIVYLVLIVPIQLRHRAETRLGERMANCTHLTPDHKITYDGECMDIAEHVYVIDKGEASSYFSARGLLTLLLVAFGLPFTLYLAIAIPLLLLRRYRPSNASPRKNHA